jgi:hypothetical protein
MIYGFLYMENSTNVVVSSATIHDLQPMVKWAQMHHSPSKYHYQTLKENTSRTLFKFEDEADALVFKLKFGDKVI